MKNMKKLLFILISVITLSSVTCCQHVSAQTTQSEKVTINTSDLTPEQLDKIKSDEQVKNLQNKLDTYGKWVGVGGEIGTAVKEGLTAVVDVSDKFSKTDVGKFTLIMIAWKVMGEDVVGLVVGILFFIVVTILSTIFFRRITRDKRVLVENPGWFKYPKKYEVIKCKLDSDDLAWTNIAYIASLFIIIGISCAIIF